MNYRAHDGEKPFPMAPLPLSSQTAPEGMQEAFQDAHPPLSPPSLAVCVLVIEQQSDGCDHTNLGSGQQITLKHTGWLARIKPPWRLSFICCVKTSLLLSIQPQHEDYSLCEKLVGWVPQ